MLPGIGARLEMTFMRNHFFIWLVVLLAAGCTLKYTYNQLDWMGAQYLEGYVELSDAQQAQLRRHMATTLEWHRTTQLPRYAEWLTAFKQDVHQGLTLPLVEQHSQQLLGFWHLLKLRFANDMAELLPQLNAEQRAELVASFAEKNTDYQDDHVKVSQNKQQKAYADYLEDHFDSWLGSLSKAQKQRIKTAAAAMHPIATESLQTRQRWQRRLLEIIQQHQDSTTTRAAMQQLLMHNDALRSEAYRQMLKHNREVVMQLIVDVAQIMSDKQREHLFERIDDYIELFNELAKEQ